MRKDLSCEFVRNRYEYNPQSGEFISKKTGENPCSYSKSKIGYERFTININNYNYLASRIAWLWFYGLWPDFFIDHVNCNSLDNRIENLREATKSENMRNTLKRKDNTSGAKGVSWCKCTSKWVVRIREFKGKYHNIGRFNTIEEAIIARDFAAKKLHGDFSRSDSCLVPYF